MAQLGKYFTDIVNTKKRRVEVRAGPGCLKTTALLARSMRLLASGVSPDSILVLTFSNSAVDVIRSRMMEVATTDTLRAALMCVRAMTCHKFSLDLIKAADPKSQIVVLTERMSRALLAKAVALTAKRCQQKTIWTGASQTVRDQRLAHLNALLSH